MNLSINGFDIEKWNVHEFPIGSRTTGKIATTCVFCSDSRKKKKDKCCSIDLDKGFYTCNHCGEQGQLNTFKKKFELKNYVKPTKKINHNYSEKLVNYFESRKISIETLKRFNIGEQKEWMPQTTKEENCILFPYKFNNELINIKYRDGKKNFKLEKDAEKILFNIDAILGKEKFVICEGEIDALSIYESGFKNVCSVPNGFNLKGEISLDYLDNYIDLLDNAEKIIICSDNDQAGIKGRDELIRRFGAERCFLVDLKDKKDANEYLIAYGKDSLLKSILDAKEVKIDGIYTVEDDWKQVRHYYLNGQDRGTTTYFPQIDNAWTWRRGEVTLVTGYNNEGKTTFLFQLALIKSLMDGSKFALFSPENFPATDIWNDLIEMHIGKTVDRHYLGNLMTEDELEFSGNYIKNHFSYIYPERDFTIDTIFKKAQYLVKKRGIYGLIIDPYNTIEHKIKGNEREDLYISRLMADLKYFAVKNNMAVILVAHQITPKKENGLYPQPNSYTVKGGGTFADKVDNILFVHRPYYATDKSNPEVTFGSLKIKKQKLVGIPQAVEGFQFKRSKNRYYIDGFNPLDNIYTEPNENVITLPQPTTEEAFNINKIIEPNNLSDLTDIDDEMPF